MTGYLYVTKCWLGEILVPTDVREIGGDTPAVLWTSGGRFCGTNEEHNYPRQQQTAIPVYTLGRWVTILGKMGDHPWEGG